VIVSVVLTALICLMWLVLAGSFFVASIRPQPGASMAFMGWILGGLVLLLGLLFVGIGLRGAFMAWKGDTGIIRIPLVFTYSLAGIGVVRGLIGVGFDPSMIPVITAFCAAAGAHLLLLTPPAKAWSAPRRTPETTNSRGGYQ
jgi:hypothetical protein